ncbi:hypothetical protein F5880DRAFT_1617037 [Lentinula raphanica]|nr:hypothetical protein F5880DRAFT_1617037 [Lentinula raphanica]
MRFNIVLLLGLVSATYALPNPGLRHFQPRSDTEAEPDPQPAVGNHTFGLMPRAPISSDSAFDDGHWPPFFDPEIVATYHFIESLERTNPLRSEMEGNWDYVSRLSHWSTDLIGRRLFGHKGVTAMFYDQPVPPYEPRKWNWQLSTENAAVVIDRRTHHPAGALALTATAIKWALSLWKTGSKSTEVNGDDELNTEDADAGPTAQPKMKKRNGDLQKKNLPRNNSNSFGERWSADCNKFQDSAKNLVRAKWDLIYAASEVYLLDIPNAGAGPALKDMRKAQEVATNCEPLDDSDMIVLSD